MNPGPSRDSRCAGRSRFCSAPPLRSVILTGRRCRWPVSEDQQQIAIPMSISAHLNTAFLLTYGLMYVIWREVDGRRGNAPGLFSDHDGLVSGLCQSWSGYIICDAGGQPACSGNGRGRWISRCHQGRGRVVPRARALDGHGHHQCGHRRRPASLPAPAIAIILSYANWPWVFYLFGSVGIGLERMVASGLLPARATPASFRCREERASVKS